MYLDHFYRGKLIRNGATTSEFQIIGTTPNIANKASEIFSKAKFGTHNTPGSLAKLDNGFGLSRYNEDTFVFMHVYPAPVLDRGHVYPEYHGILIPRAYLEESGFNILHLAKLVQSGGSISFPEVENSLAPYHLDVSLNITKQEAIEYLTQLSAAIPPSIIKRIIDTVLDNKHIALDNIQEHWETKLKIIQGIYLLFPASFRSNISFATEVFDSSSCDANIKLLFHDNLVKPSPTDISSTQIKSNSPTVENAKHQYSVLVSELLMMDIPRLIEIIDEIETKIAADNRILYSDTIHVIEVLSPIYLLTNAPIKKFVDQIELLATLLKRLSISVKHVNISEIDWDLFITLIKSNKIDAQSIGSNASELADLIVTLSKNRTKAKFLQKQQTFDTMMTNGDITPRNLVDVLRRLSGELKRK